MILVRRIFRSETKIFTIFVFLTLLFYVFPTVSFVQPLAVSNLVAISGIENLSEGSIKLTWTYPGPDILPEGSTYYIQYSTFSEISWSTAEAQVIISTYNVNPYTEQSYVLTGLDNFLKSNSLSKETTFYFALWTSSGTEGLLSEISNIATGWITLIPPSKPYFSGSTQGVYEGSVKLDWSGGGDDGASGALTGKWYIQYSTYETFNDWNYTDAQVVISTADVSPGTTKSYQVTGLIAGVTYYFRLWAEDDLGNISEISDGATTWAQVDISPPRQVTSFSGLVGFRHVTLSWIIPYEDSYEDGFLYNSGSYTGYYEIRYSLQEITDETLWQQATRFITIGPVMLEPQTSTTVVITGLENFTSYYFSIKVADENLQWSVHSSSSPMFQPINTKPWCIYPEKHYVYDPVRNITALIISSTSVLLSWTDAVWNSGRSFNDNSFDSDYGDFISSYTIHLSTFITANNIGTSTKTISGIQTSWYVVHELTEDTTYYWSLTAYDSEGFSSTTFLTSNRFIINSQNSPPIFPSNPLIRPTTVWSTQYQYPTKIEFDWKDAVDLDAGDSVVGYKIYISSYPTFSSSLSIPSGPELITTSYFLMTENTTPSCWDLFPYENQKLYWYVVAYDSGSPFGYPQKSTQTPIGWFYITQSGEPPNPFVVHHPTSTNNTAIEVKLVGNTTYYIAKSTPIILSWEPTTDPDPDYISNGDVVYEYISQYLVFICSASFSNEPFQGAQSNWREETGQPSVFLSTSIVELPGSFAAGKFELPIVENMTYYYRIAAYDGSSVYGPYGGIPNGGFGVKYCLSPSTDSLPRSFIIDFYKDPPTGYSPITPVGVINPSHLGDQEPGIYFDWTDATDPDPFDKLKYYYLCISSIIPNSGDEWFTTQEWHVIVWLGENPVSSATVMFTNPKLIPGVTYYWQVLAWGETDWEIGTSTSFPITSKPYGFMSSTASFVVSNNIPNMFNLISPGTSTMAGFTPGIKNFKPTFYWEAVSDPDNYDPVISSYVVTISSSIDFSSEIRVWSSTNWLVIPFELQPKTTYWWYVTAFDKFQNYRISNSTFVFQTTNFEPEMFSLISPKNDVVVPTLTPIFQWQNNGDPDNDPIYYSIQISSYPDFSVYFSSGEFIYPSLKGSTVSITSPWVLNENLQYFWRVVADDYSGGVTTSTISSFWTNAIEEPPKSFDIHITSGFVSSLPLNFSWQTTTDPDPKDYVYQYRLCISTISGYVVGVSTYILLVGSNNVTATIAEFTENASYRWWVEAIDTKGYTTQSVSSYVFTINTTSDPLDSFDLLFPGSTTTYTKVQQPITFLWTPANKTEWWENVNYTIYFSSISGIMFSTQVYSGGYKPTAESSLITCTTSIQILNLEENTTYFWYVKAESSNSIKFSSTFYFFVDTENDPPEKFSLLKPSGTVITRTPEFCWQLTYDVDDDITRYEVLVSSKLPNFIVVATVNNKTSSYTLTLEQILNMQTTYYWKVRAYDERSSFTVTDQWSFYVPEFKLSSVTVLSPEKIAATRKPKIEWTPAIHPEPNSWVKEYYIILSTGTANDPARKEFLTTTTSYQITENLFQNVTYYLTIIPVDNWGVQGVATEYSFYIPRVNIPQKVLSIDCSMYQNDFILSWREVTTYIDGTTADDIVGYNIYRSQKPQTVGSPQTKYSFVSSTATFFIDTIWGNTFYYGITVVTLTNVESELSEIVSSYRQGSKIIIDKETESNVILPSSLANELRQLGYTITVTPQQIPLQESLYLNTINKYKLEVTKNGSPVRYKLPTSVELNLKISTSTIYSVPSLAEKNSSLVPSLFYDNNIEYIFVNSQYLPQENMLYTVTNKLGDYVIRLTLPENQEKIVSIYPKKIFTPQATENNKIHFVLYNPTLSTPQGEIYDLSLRYVAKMKLENNELVWDGKYDSGEFVPKGIYIYKITIGTKTFSGSIIVAK